jgi:hypothetical protein
MVRRPEGKRLLGRPKRRWEDNIKIQLRPVGWGSMDWMDLAEVRGFVKCREFLDKLRHC